MNSPCPQTTKKKTLKTPRAKLKELRQELHYRQGQVKTERRWVKESEDLCREIGAKMRKLQKEINERK